MHTNSTSPAKQAREALGARLREIRKAAGLTGRVLAATIGCHYTKVSRIENGSQAPTEDNIKAWCRACKTEPEIPDLIATARAIESMYVEWRRHTRAGMKRLMLTPVPLYKRTKLFRIYEHSVIPGLFQTAEYSSVILRYFINFLDTPNDLDAALQARMERQRIIYSGHRRFAVILDENAIRAQVGGPGIMAGQLDRLLETMVGVETPTAKLEIVQPNEIRLYVEMFEHLRQSAVFGAQARGLIIRAMAVD